MTTPLEKKKVPILMYHSISQHASSKFAQFAVSPGTFARQMEYLYQKAYHTLTVTQFIGIVQRGEVLPERPIILTFDDGFADFFTDALPVLRQYGFVATLYVATGFVNATSRWLEREGEADRPMLSWDQLTEISRHGIECGAHSHTHPQLDTLPLFQAQEEIVMSKAILERHLEQKIVSFAYPFGYYTAKIKKFVQMSGYLSACAVKHAMSSEDTDPFALTRFIIKTNTDLDTFKTLVTGSDPSLKMTMDTMYARLRTPIWQVVRKSSASLTRYLQGGLELK